MARLAYLRWLTNSSSAQTAASCLARVVRCLPFRTLVQRLRHLSSSVPSWNRVAGNWVAATWVAKSLGRQSLGRQGEQYAARFLRGKGYEVLGSRVRNRYGEIDLIAIDGRTVVFVEVKTWRARPGVAIEDPAVAVDGRKQLRLTRTAVAFLKQHRLLQHPARFDVVSLVWQDALTTPRIRHFVNAFEPVGIGQWFY